MLQRLVRADSLPRSLRTLALVGAQVTTLGLGAAGVVAWQTATEPATAQTTPEACVPAAGELSVADIAERANPAVVTIRNLATIDEQSPLGEEASDDPVAIGSGSGFIIADSGLVITNSHVVLGAEDLEVRFFDGTTVRGTVVGQDDPNLLDVALVQLDLPAGTTVPGVLAFGDSDAVRPGDQVVAIGSSLGEFTNTVTEGMVNAVGRSLGGYGLRSLIQHDAEIWRGNSGGPLLNMQGEVIGVNSAGLSDNQMSVTAPADIAFAISSNAVQSIIDQIETTGGVARPFMGITGAPVEDGHEITEVEPNTPASTAGLRPGDVIVAVNGVALTDEVGLLDTLFEYQPGDTITLEVERNGATETIELTLGTRPTTSQ